MIRSASEQLAARITRLATAEAVARRAAGILADAFGAGIAERGSASLALSGDSTPIATFHELRRRKLNWRQVCVTLVDERGVEPISPDSHQRALEEHLVAARPDIAILHGPQ